MALQFSTLRFRAVVLSFAKVLQLTVACREGQVIYSLVVLLSCCVHVHVFMHIYVYTVGGES